MSKPILHKVGVGLFVMALLMAAFFAIRQARSAALAAATNPDNTYALNDEK